MVWEQVVGCSEGVGIVECGILRHDFWENWVVSKGGNQLELLSVCSHSQEVILRARICLEVLRSRNTSGVQQYLKSSRCRITHSVHNTNSRLLVQKRRSLHAN